ncbi:MAG: SpoIIE family protein phosphatase [Bryobacteraceae bacterium]|nr:SpoIIE family protein phosphatase [Bryobacteraceae bacterium]
MSISANTNVLLQLRNRRNQLESLVRSVDDPHDILRVLQQVDAVLDRIKTGTYGECSVCHTSIGEDQLADNPLAEYCLCHLDEAQQTLLGQDLSAAWRIQAALLPCPDLATAHWESHYRFQPHGAVSGDYCDLIPRGDDLHFVVADVSGKGVAAAIVMSHLSATLRALIRAGASLPEQLSRVNDILRESAFDSHYATVVIGKLGPDGEAEMLNAGHCPPLLLQESGVTPVAASGPPVGLLDLDDSAHAVQRFHVQRGDSLLLYTDGVIEAMNAEGDDFGLDRLMQVSGHLRGAPPNQVVSAVLEHLRAFLRSTPRNDDLTALALRRVPQPA